MRWCGWVSLEMAAATQGCHCQQQEKPVLPPSRGTITGPD